MVSPCMIIITQYEERYNAERKAFYVVRSESVGVQAPVCPACLGGLVARDSRRRYVIQPDGSRKAYQLRRLRCKKCRGIHTEPPACIQPRKHYGVAVIEGELDQRRKDCPAEDSTRRRWRSAFAQAKVQIEGALKAIRGRILKKGYPLLSIEQFQLGDIISSGPGWLALVNQLLIHAGHGLHTRFAF